MAPPFDLGIASFDPLADRVLLWTRLAGGGGLTWQVATDPALRDVVAGGRAVADAEPWTVTVDVAGLAPSTTYWYRFTAADGGEHSPVGRTRTLPAGRSDRLRLGVACCSRYSQSTFAVYRALAGADVDLVLHLGDYVYEDAKEGLPGREPEPPHDAVTLADYRARHAQHRRDPDLQALHAAHPVVAVWDDHDIADNAWRGGAKSHDEERDGPWAARLAAATTAHQEFVPKRLADPADPASSWRCFDAGSLVRLVCTETRVAGRDEQAGLDDGEAAEDPDRSLLGEAQRRWLLPLVADPGPRWVLLASGTVVSELALQPVPKALDGLLPEKYAVVGDCAVNTDQWDGYVAERRRVAEALGRRGGAAVVLSGDIHSSWAIEGPAGPDGEPVAVELTCPPAATTPIGRLVPLGEGVVGPRLADAFAPARWVDADHHGYLVADVATDRLTATYWWVDPSGDGRPVRGAVFATFPGRPGRLHRLDPDPSPAAEAPERRRRRWPRRAAALAAGAAGVAVAVARRRGARTGAA